MYVYVYVYVYIYRYRDRERYISTCICIIHIYIYTYVLYNLINSLGFLASYTGSISSRGDATSPARFAFLGRSRSPYDEVLGEAGGVTNEVAIHGSWGNHKIIPSLGYPLLNLYITTETHHFLMGKSPINGPFSSIFNSCVKLSEGRCATFDVAQSWAPRRHGVLLRASFRRAVTPKHQLVVVVSCWFINPSVAKTYYSGVS